MAQAATLEQQVIGDQFLAIGMQHAGDAAQQGLHLRFWLQGPAARHRDALGGRGGWHQIGGRQPTGRAARQLGQQPLLLLFAAQVALVEHQHQPLAQPGQGFEELLLRGPQVAVHHQQQQVGAAGLLPGQVLATLAGIAGLQDAGGIHQPDGSIQPPQPQAIALAALGAAHGGAHLAHQLAQQGPDQGGFAHRTAAKHNDLQIAPLQFGGHPLPFLAEQLPLQVIAHPLQGLIDRRQILGCSLATAGGVGRPPWRLAASGPAAAGRLAAQAGGQPGLQPGRQ